MDTTPSELLFTQCFQSLFLDVQGIIQIQINLSLYRSFRSFSHLVFSFYVTEC